MLSAKQLLKRSESFALLETLQDPTHVWKYFLMLTETPRPSGKLDGLRSKLLGLAGDLGCEAEVDQTGNVRFRMPASAGCEQAQRICIQAHLDMVTSANSDVSINFDTDPINVYLTEREGDQWMLAKGTTLGADNGLGVASALALFEDAKAGKLPHGQLEALFTVDEETTMIGAMDLAPEPFLQSDILLNVDSEEEYAICIGCAGGAENSYSFPITRSAVENHKQIAFHIKGLLGGHSGVDVHQGRANAIQVLNRMIRSASNATSNTARYVDFSATGAPNVIPREAKALVSVPSDKVESFLEAFNASLEKTRSMYLPAEHREEDGKRKTTIQVDINQLESQSLVPLSETSSNKVTDFIDTMPNGVIRMNYDIPGMVETSTNFANLTIADTTADAYTFSRSSSSIEQDLAQESFESFARLSNATVSAPLNPFPGWQPDISCSAVVEMQEAHKIVMKQDAKVYSIHAGLECGLLQAVYPKMKCVSVGPEIRGAHSPDERLLVPSVKRFYDLVLCFVERISKIPRA